ncbi:hypothetical protein [Morganella morganii]|uniref:hypothetical protein n=1 Tax=Morganella morganii TaxID=582 RepID=UPI001D12295C|nr:hypothetical protein [Morganella morganii]
MVLIDAQFQKDDAQVLADKSVRPANATTFISAILIRISIFGLDELKKLPAG